MKNPGPFPALVVVLAAFAGLPCTAHAQWIDPFDTISPAWVVDRYAPAAFQTAYFLGDNRLQITIEQTGSTVNRPSAFNASFYNTQGEQRPGDILGEWSLSAEVYISSAYDTTTGQLVQSELMAESGDDPSTGEYAIFGFTNASPTDPLNPEASDRSFRFQIFDGGDTDGGWYDVGLPTGFTFDAWHTLEFTDTGTDFEFLLDGVAVFDEPTTTGEDLQTAFIEAYNFGQTGAGGLNSYSVYWDNLTAVPEPTNFALAAGLGTLGLVWIRRRASRKH
jgi:hypothetical protein